MLVDSPSVNEVNELIIKCREKINFHKENAHNSLRWHNFLGLLSVSIAGLQTVVMTCLGVYKTDDSVVSITGSVFGFATLLLGRIVISYNFNVLNVLHNIVVDDFIELETKLQLLDSENIDKNLFDSYMHRYVGITEKSHLQCVNECYFLRFFC